jgi:G3E family GTPase
MNLFVIAGFLGSGKTSLLLAVAKAFSEAGRKLAIIENEIGKVGVDDIVLSEEGLTVREIYSGCICCSLRLDLINVLLELEREMAPDVVLLEPSGVASPRQALLALDGYGGEIDRRHVAVVIDAERFLRLSDLNIPIIADGIEAADILVINKTDLVDAECLDAISRRIRKIRPDVKIICVSALNNVNVNLLVEEFMAIPLREKAEEKKLFLTRARQGMPAVPVARSYTLSANGNLAHEHFSSQLAEILKNIAGDLEIAACKAIGHIKAVAKAAEGGYLMVSVTSTGRAPDVKGRLPARISQLKIALNVIVYGINLNTVEEIVDARFGEDGLWRALPAQLEKPE